jgi:hypothetical protein
MTRPRISWKEIAIAVLIAARIGGLALILHSLPQNVAGHYVGTDAIRFNEIATTAGTPYRDFEVEVPPIEYFELKLIGGATARDTAITLAWSQVVVDLVVVFAMVLGWGRNAALAYLVISLPLAPFLYFRLDLLSVALAALAMAFVRRRRDSAGGVTLALAVLTKMWPVVLAPALALQRKWKSLALAGGCLAAGVIGWVLWAGAGAPMQVITFRHSHGWQIESTVGALMLKFSRLPVIYEGGANRIGYASVPSRAALSLILAGLLALATWIAAKHQVGSDGVLPLVSVGLLLLAAPILSWQYIAWLFPWAAVALADRERGLGAMTFVLAGVSALLIFQGIPLTEKSAFAENLLLARNALLAVVVAFGFIRMIRSPVRD